MKMLPLMLVMLTSQMMTTHEVEFKWREKTPAQLQEWFQSRVELKLGGPEEVLGKADEEKERSLIEPRHFDLTRIYKLADGSQLELNYLRIGASSVQEGHLFLRQYGVWQVDASGLRREVWKSERIIPNTKPVKIQFRRGKSGDVPERMYEIKDGAVG